MVFISITGKLLAKVLLVMFNIFFNYGNIDPEINQTHICLIPKIESHVEVKD